MAKIFTIFTLLIITSCAGITTLKKVDRSKLYGQDFLESVNKVNTLIDQKKLNEAEIELRKMDESSLTENETSLKRYLLGRFYLSEADIEKAIFNFELALSGSGEDVILASQSFLGLAIGYFKIGIYDRALNNLTKLNNDHLGASEKLNSFSIGYQISKAYQNQDLYEQSLIGLVSMLGENNFASDPYYEELFGLLIAKALDDQKILALNFVSQGNHILINLALSMTENLIYSGRSEDALEVLDNVSIERISYLFKKRISELRLKLLDDKKVESNKIGVILPLSGKYKKYGLEALNGIQAAYEVVFKEKNFVLKIRDSKSSPAISSFFAKELFEKEKVGLIIGGLSSGEAKSIYLELKNKQVPFISMAQVFLPRDKKDRFLIEMPPSIESEVMELISEKNLEKIGRKGAIIFPLDEAGEYYFDELFSYNSDRFKLVSGINYKVKGVDLRNPVKSLLNLKYPKLRNQELNLMKGYFDADENSAVRRVQVLAPEINFDWVFIPSRQIEALQIIPSFNYYDAFNTLIIGPASWNNKKIKKLGNKNRKMHFLHQKESEGQNYLVGAFENSYSRPPNVVSKRAMNSLGLAASLIPDTETRNRTEYLNHFKSIDVMDFAGQSWKFEENVWIKRLSVYHLHRGISREGVKN